jgi:cell shape-determining protein MreC
MANEKQSPAVNIEQLVNQQFEMLKTLRDKRKELKEVEAKNRELKSQISAALNLPKGVSISVKRAQA